MTPLGERIAALIAATGPISVAEYMQICLFDPQQGYYSTRQPFGSDGDFVTAPEISQLFGELVAVWLYSAWRRAGGPRPVAVAEIGPGRGTLMRDMARTLRRLDPALHADAAFALVETSERLMAVQRQTLADTGIEPAWHARPEELDGGFTLLVANELFDALPVRQYTLTDRGWRERVIGLDAENRLCFMAGPGQPDEALLPAAAAAARPGDVVELAPARTAMTERLAAHLAAHGGAGLAFDYGYLEPGLGDTLQAVRAHRYADVLSEPGAADLTAHVDFSALAGAARRHGLSVGLGTQGEFLEAMGILKRAERLSDAAGAAPAKAAQRLVSPDGMGTLFKVIGFWASDGEIYPFGGAD